MYLGSDEGWKWIHDYIRDDLRLREPAWFSPNAEDSKFAKWVKINLDKHMGIFSV